MLWQSSVPVPESHYFSLGFVPPPMMFPPPPPMPWYPPMMQQQRQQQQQQQPADGEEIAGECINSMSEFSYKGGNATF